MNLGRSLSERVSGTLFVLVGLLVFVGGRAIFAFTRTKPLIARMESIGLASVCAALGFVAKRAAKHFDQGGDPTGQ